MAKTKQTTCEADKRSKAWGEAAPCDRAVRGNGLCNGHLAQLSRLAAKGWTVSSLAPLRGLHGQKLKDEVQLGSPRVEREVAKTVEQLGAVLGAKPERARYRGIQALAEGYHAGTLRWARGKEPKPRKRS